MNFIRIGDNIIFLRDTDVSEEGGTGSCKSPDKWQGPSRDVSFDCNYSRIAFCSLSQRRKHCLR